MFEVNTNVASREVPSPRAQSHLPRPAWLHLPFGVAMTLGNASGMSRARHKRRRNGP